MQFVFKKTIELTSEEKNGLLDQFNAIMEKDRTLQEWESMYLNTALGYSFHILMLDDGKLAGQNTGIPIYYQTEGKRSLFICNVDTMIDPGYRGLENIYDLFKFSFNQFKDSGISLVYGFPNDMAYPVEKALKIMKDVGRLDTYCLPYRIGGIKPSLKILNPFSRMFSCLFLLVSGLCSPKKKFSFQIQKEESSFNAFRYKWLDGGYQSVQYKGTEFVYKLKRHEGVRTAFLVDVRGKNPRNFRNAVRYILRKEKQNMDLLLYVGHLPFRHSGLIKFPEKYEPKHFHFMASILDEKSLTKETVFDLSHWDINLSNYDLI